MIRFCTFNVENLFSRPKAMNLANRELGTDKLVTVARLQAELARPVYDRQAIADLARAAHGYFMVNKTRGASPLSWDAEADVYRVKVRGRDDWEGFIELARDRFEHGSVANTGDFIRSLRADVLALCEVENMEALRRFRSDRLAGADLRHEILIDGNDGRGIDVAVLSRLPIGNVRTRIHETPSGSGARIFSRDCLTVEILTPGGAAIHVLQNHFTSKLSSDEGVARRTAQARRVAAILAESFDLATDFVIVSGDLNDTPDSGSLKPLVRLEGLRDALEVGGVPAAERWTYAYRAERNQIDYVLVSEALAARLSAARVDRTGIADLERLSDGRERSRPGITSWRNAASDHAAVIVDFDL